MPAFVLTDARIIVGTTDISQFTGQYSPTSTVAMQPANVFGAGGFERRRPGLKSFTDAFSGFADYDVGAIASVFNSSQLGAQQLVSIAPTGGATAGDPVAFTRALIDGIAAPGGAIGDMASFDMSLTSDTAKANGVVASPLALRTSTFVAPVVAMAGPTASQRIYIGLHVPAATGAGTMVVTIHSDPLVGFGTATLRATLPATTAATAGWQFFSVAGAITDGFYRATLTQTGAGNITSAVVIGVA